MSITQITSDLVTDDAVTLAKMAGGTDGQIITYDASGNPTAVGPGTDGQVLTSTGAGSPPAFENAGGGGAWTLISTGTASNSASLDFTGLGSTYDVHVLVFNDVRPASDGRQLSVKVGIGSTTYQDNGYKYLGNKRLSTNGNDDYVFSNDDTSGLSEFRLTGSTGNASGENASGWMYCFSLASTGHKHFAGQFPSSQLGGSLQGGEFFGQFTKTDPITALRVKWNSGNIASGKVRLYGINNS